MLLPQFHGKESAALRHRREKVRPEETVTLGAAFHKVNACPAPHFFPDQAVGDYMVPLSGVVSAIPAEITAIPRGPYAATVAAIDGGGATGCKGFTAVSASCKLSHGMVIPTWNVLIFDLLR